MARIVVKYLKVTGLSSSKNLLAMGFSQQEIEASVSMEIFAESQGVRWRSDGINPTTTDGMPIPANSARNFDLPLTNLAFIESAASATAHVTLYKGA